MTRYLVHAIVLPLAGRGAEPAGTAAVATRTRIDAAHQAEEMKADFQARLDAAARLEKRKPEQVEAGARP